MTQTVKRIPGQRTTRRLGFVYAYDTLRVDANGMPTSGIQVGYVGKTVQKLNARDDQHRGLAPGPDGTPAECQPFSDIIVGSIRIVEQGMWTDAELDDRETAYIAALLPAYNHQKQPAGNPNRIWLSDSRRFRDNRDLARGLQPRTWPEFRSARNAPCRPDVRRSKLSPKWRRRRNAVLGWTCGWLGAVLTAWLLLALLLAPHLPLSWREWPVLAAGLCTEPLVLLARWGDKRKTRDLRRALAGLIAVATVALMVVAL